MANKIRNINQTAQERTVIKSAPDVCAYLNGLPYLVNRYISGDGQQSTVSFKGQSRAIVNFNDQLVGFQCTVDTENLLPSATITLSVPNDLKHLYMMPGGMNLLESMMEVQVYCKGYYPSRNNNSLYHRVFKGLVSHVSHTDTGRSVEISIQCMGSLYFLQLMQIDLNPAVDSNSSLPSTPLTSIEHNLTPYEMLAHQFQMSLKFQGFNHQSISEEHVDVSDFGAAVEAGYVVKWQRILDDLAKDVHIFGYTMDGQQLPDDPNAIATSVPDAQGAVSPDLRSIKNTYVGKLLESAIERDLYTNILRTFTPDFGVTATIQLENGRIMSRLERIRHIIEIIGFEAFQDVNGEIIIKPPLYNLDVTDTTLPPGWGDAALTSQIDLGEGVNPFILNLDEIDGADVETEDQQAIRATRVSTQTNWGPAFQIKNNTDVWSPTVWHIDVAKMAKFGLREEAAKLLPWSQIDDRAMAYTYCVSEMNRKNRAFRTYSFTIPIRPELRLGFPMYVPHRDMYGYIRSITINYSQGQSATMNVMLDTLRKRPMFPSTKKVPGSRDPKTGQEQEVEVFTTQPNLVLKWTAPPAKSQAQASTTDMFNASNPWSNVMGIKSSAAGNGEQCSTDPAVNFIGNPMTQATPALQPLYDEEVRANAFHRDIMGTYWGTQFDTKTNNFRVQKDVGEDGKPFFSKENLFAPVGSRGVPRGVDRVYFETIISCQPFTDEKGYEVVSPFPWGRFKTLPEAIAETREGRVTAKTADTTDKQVLENANAFIFAGLGTPSADSAAQLSDKLKQVFGKTDPQTGTESALDSSVIELSYSEGDNPTLPTTDTKDLFAIAAQDDVKKRVDAFVSGSFVPMSSDSLNILNAKDAERKATTPVGLTPNQRKKS